MPNRTLSPKHSLSAPKTLEKLSNTVNPELGRFDPFQANRVLDVGDDSGHHPCTRTGQGGGARRGDLSGKISRPTAAGRARIGPTNSTATTMVGHQFSSFFGHFRPNHTFLPSFLDPLNSFSWSFFVDSSPFERYDENKFGQRLDRVFRPPQQFLDQGKGISVFLVSWAFR